MFIKGKKLSLQFRIKLNICITTFNLQFIILQLGSYDDVRTRKTNPLLVSSRFLFGVLLWGFYIKLHTHPKMSCSDLEKCVLKNNITASKFTFSVRVCAIYTVEQNVKVSAKLCLPQALFYKKKKNIGKSQRNQRANQTSGF